MLEVKVKTLDSVTREFSVADDITVKGFKEHVAETVSIPATTQRLIFRGRVLKDEKKLSEYDCDKQVIHLVEKPPPSTTTGTSSSTSRSTTSSEGNNNFFLGAVHLPAEVADPIEIQQTVQQVLSNMGDLGRNARVTSRSSPDGSSVDVHINLGPIAIQAPPSPAQLRVNQINNMIRQANAAIDNLENPNNNAPRNGSARPNSSNLTQNTSTPVQRGTPSGNASTPAPSASTATANTPAPSVSTATFSANTPALSASTTATCESTPAPSVSTPASSVSTPESSTSITPATTNPSEVPRNSTSQATIDVQSETPSSTTPSSTDEMDTDSPPTVNQRSSIQNGNAPAGVTSGQNGTASAGATTGQNGTAPAGTTTGQNGTALSAGATTGQNGTAAAGATTGQNGTALSAGTTTGQNGTASAGTTTGQNGTGQQQRRTNGQGNRPSSQNPQATELSGLLQQVERLNTRLQPHIERYRQMLVNQPQFENGSEELRQARRLQGIVSQVMHYISHIYHNFSDFNVCLVQRPPRVATVPTPMLSNMGPIPLSLVGHPVTISANQIASAVQRAAQTSSTQQQRTTPTSTANGTRTSGTQTSSSRPAGTSVANNNSSSAANTSQPPNAVQPTSTTGMPVRPTVRIPQRVSASVASGPRFQVRGMQPPQGMRINLPPNMQEAGRHVHIRGPHIEIRQIHSSANNDARPMTPMTPGMMQNIAQMIMQQIQQAYVVGGASNNLQPPREGAPRQAEPASQGSQSEPSTPMDTGNTTPQTDGSSNASTDAAPAPAEDGDSPGTIRVEMTQAHLVTPGMVQVNMPAGQGRGGLMRMAPHLSIRRTHTLSGGPTPSSSSQTPGQGSPNSTTQTSTTSSSSAPGGSTNTTYTTTTSQSPHVTIRRQGLWDPFLPCFSRHRQLQAASRPGQQGTTNANPLQASVNSSAPGGNAFTEIISGLVGALTNQAGSQQASGNQPQPATARAGTTGQSSQNDARPQSSSSTAVQGSSQGQGRSSNQEEVLQNMLHGVLQQAMGFQSGQGGGSQQTLDEFLQSIQIEAVHPGGFIGDLIMCLSRSLTMSDISMIFLGDNSPIRRIRPDLRRFVMERILTDAIPTHTNIQDSVRRVVRESHDYLAEFLGDTEVVDNIDAVATFQRVMEQALIDFCKLTVGQDACPESEYADRLMNIVKLAMQQWLMVLSRMLGGRNPMRSFVCTRMQTSLGGGESPLSGLISSMFSSNLELMLSSVTISERDVVQFIVKKGETTQDTAQATQAKLCAPATSTGVDTNSVHSASSGSDTMETARTSSPEAADEAMDVDGTVEKPKPDSTSIPKKPTPNKPPHRPRPAASSSSMARAARFTSNIPAGNGSSSSWEAVVPSEWVPVMKQDMQRQRRQAPQGPLSDAYLHGLPAKRLKLTQDQKLPVMRGTQSFVSETLRKAVENAGVTPLSSMDAVLEETQNDTELHKACDEQVKSALKQRLRHDPDHDSKRFPNTERYMQKK